MREHRVAAPDPCGERALPLVGGEVPAAALPARLLHARAGPGGRHGRGDAGLVCELHAHSRLRQPHVLLQVLGEAAGAPGDTAQELCPEGHPGAEEAAGEPQGGLPPRADDVHQREPRPAQRGGVGLPGVGGQVRDLHGFRPRVHARGHRAQQVARGPAVGVDHHHRAGIQTFAGHPVERPLERGALARSRRVVALPDRRPGVGGDGGGGVPACVGDDDRLVLAVELPDGRERVGNDGRLVVRRDQDHEPARDSLPRRVAIIRRRRGQQREEIGLDRGERRAHDR